MLWITLYSLISDCGADGIFAKGDRSIVFCSGGVATYQKCADKTRHSYQASHGPYGYGAGFCDVNENDYNTGYGYGAPRHFGY